MDAHPYPARRKSNVRGKGENSTGAFAVHVGRYSRLMFAVTVFIAEKSLSCACACLEAVC